MDHLGQRIRWGVVCWQGDYVKGIDEVRMAASEFSPEEVAPVCGVDATVIRRLAHELADAETAVVYGRIGTHTAEFGTTASWLADVLNILTGNMDRAGGAITAPAPRPRCRGAGGPG